MKNRLFSVFLLFFFGLFSLVGAQSTPNVAPKAFKCQALKMAFQHYAYSEFEETRAALAELKDDTLTPACKAEKYMLIGAVNVVSFMMNQSGSFEEADRNFVISLLADPFRAMDEAAFPPLLIRKRFEYNRQQLNQGDLQMASSSGAAESAEDALRSAELNAVRSYVGQYFSAERFATILSDTDMAEAILSVRHASKSRIEEMIRDSSGVTVSAANLIDRKSVLSSVNQSGVLFDMEKPYVRLDLTETIEGVVSQSRVALTGIKKALQEAGFTVIDETMPNTEAHILVRGNVDATAERIGMGMGWGGWAISNLTMRWADGSNYEFGSQIEKRDGKGKMMQREAAFSALENLTTALASHIKQTCISEWNSRTLNGAIHLIELKGNLNYEDFRRMLVQLSTFALNDPLDNPRFVADGTTQIYIRYRPQDGDLADVIRREGFYNLSKNYKTEVQQVSFNHVVLNVKADL
ncbi:MAG: hypothetical protein JNN12_08400 [Bacteroidetes Order II. Incertae sedis bacterium]|nr:hypothetical protein [Bacteroidetes Order II. bacterium]